MGAPALQVLLQADWERLNHLQLTVNLQDFAVFEQFVAGCEHQQVRYLQAQAAKPSSSFVLEGRRSRVLLPDGEFEVLEGRSSQPPFNCFAQWSGLKQLCIQYVSS